MSEAYFETVFKVGNVKFVLGETLFWSYDRIFFDIYISVFESGPTRNWDFNHGNNVGAGSLTGVN